MTFRSGIFQWISRDQWAPHICEELRPVLSYMETTYGVRVAALGLWNCKAPDPVAFLNAPLPVSQLRADLALRKLRYGSLGQYAGLAPSVILEGEFLGCSKCRLSVVFESST